MLSTYKNNNVKSKTLVERCFLDSQIKGFTTLQSCYHPIRNLKPRSSCSDAYANPFIIGFFNALSSIYSFRLGSILHQIKDTTIDKRIPHKTVTPISPKTNNYWQPKSTCEKGSLLGEQLPDGRLLGT